MVTLSTKLYAVVTVPGLMSMATGYLAITDGSAVMYRMSIIFAAAALLLGLVTWAHHRITWTQQRLALVEADRDMDAMRVSDMRRKMLDTEKRLAKAEDQLRCRRLVKDMFTMSDEELHALLENPDGPRTN